MNRLTKLGRYGWMLAFGAPLLLIACLEEGRERDTPQPSAGLAGETALFEGGLWDDGNAEIAAYSASEDRYGSVRDGDAMLIVVKEEFDAGSLVKADGDGHGQTVTVMKLNTVLTIPAGVYAYRQMASAFLTRREARPVKLAVGSQEWCGLTSKVLTVRGSDAILRSSSYFGAEGDQAWHLAIDQSVVLGDSLPMWLRTLDLERQGPREVRIVDEQLSNHAGEPRIRDAVIEVLASEHITVPHGPHEAVPVRVRRAGQDETFWLDRAAPHTLVRWDRADGGTYSLRWVRRAPYWAMNGLEHEGAFEQAMEPERDVSVAETEIPAEAEPTGAESPEAAPDAAGEPPTQTGSRP